LSQQKWTRVQLCLRIAKREREREMALGRRSGHLQMTDFICATAWDDKTSARHRDAIKQLHTEPALIDTSLMEYDCVRSTDRLRHGFWSTHHTNVNPHFPLVRFNPRFSAVLQIYFFCRRKAAVVSRGRSRKVYVLIAVNTIPSVFAVFAVSCVFVRTAA